MLEDIRVCMEINNPEMSQRRISSVKFLGEVPSLLPLPFSPPPHSQTTNNHSLPSLVSDQQLYNYRMVNSKVVFSVLYSFITFGAGRVDLDSPDNYFR